MKKILLAIKTEIKKYFLTAYNMYKRKKINFFTDYPLVLIAVVIWTILVWYSLSLTDTTHSIINFILIFSILSILLIGYLVKYLIFKYKISCPPNNSMLIIKDKNNENKIIATAYWLNDYQLSSKLVIKNSQKNIWLKGTIYDPVNKTYKIIFSTNLIFGSSSIHINLELILLDYTPDILLAFLLLFNLPINKSIRDGLLPAIELLFEKTKQDILNDFQKYYDNPIENLDLINPMKHMKNNISGLSKFFPGHTNININISNKIS